MALEPVPCFLAGAGVGGVPELLAGPSRGEEVRDCIRMGTEETLGLVGPNSTEFRPVPHGAIGPGRASLDDRRDYRAVVLGASCRASQGLP